MRCSRHPGYIGFDCGKSKSPILWLYTILAIILPVLPIISLLHFWPQVTSNPNFGKKKKMKTTDTTDRGCDIRYFH